MGRDCACIDSRFVNSITVVEPWGARRDPQGQPTLLHTTGLRVNVKGVCSADDLEQLSAMGLSAASGPALAAEPALTPS